MQSPFCGKCGVRRKCTNDLFALERLGSKLFLSVVLGISPLKFHGGTFFGAVLTNGGPFPIPSKLFTRDSPDTTLAPHTATSRSSHAQSTSRVSCGCNGREFSPFSAHPATILERMSRNNGSSTSWAPEGVTWVLSAYHSLPARPT